jgi:hypothetical protein
LALLDRAATRACSHVHGDFQSTKVSTGGRGTS